MDLHSDIDLLLVFLLLLGGPPGLPGQQTARAPPAGVAGLIIAV
jgi:hypothetical protein